MMVKIDLVDIQKVIEEYLTETDTSDIVENADYHSRMISYLLRDFKTEQKPSLGVYKTNSGKVYFKPLFINNEQLLTSEH